MDDAPPQPTGGGLDIGQGRSKQRQAGGGQARSPNLV